MSYTTLETGHLWREDQSTRVHCSEANLCEERAISSKLDRENKRTYICRYTELIFDCLHLSKFEAHSPS